jgi:hypothetical protein
LLKKQQKKGRGKHTRVTVDGDRQAGKQVRLALDLGVHLSAQVRLLSAHETGGRKLFKIKIILTLNLVFF